MKRKKEGRKEERKEKGREGGKKKGREKKIPPLQNVSFETPPDLIAEFCLLTFCLIVF